VRRQLAILVLAITVMIVVSFTIPLALLVQREAKERAQVGAERDAQEIAGLVGLSASTGQGPESLANVVNDMPTGMSIWLPDGTTIGNLLPGQGAHVDSATDSLTPASGDIEDGGWEVAIPIVSQNGVLVVNAAVTAQAMDEGVVGAWLLLGLLGLFLIVAAVWVGDRMARSLVKPINELATVARQLGDGDLGARSTVDGPPEFKEVGGAFNYLAGRLNLLLAQEREVAADLSHRLRTPLTSLRLHADGLAEPNERVEILTGIDRLEHSIDQLILASRAPRSEEGSECDLVKTVEERVRFWSVLAQEQGRDVQLYMDDGPILVAVPKESVESAVDILLDNIFDHTPEGTSFSVAVSAEPVPTLVVADRGPGLPAVDVTERGVSGSGSTGLGLDIARRTAETSGGSLQIDDRPGGGTIIILEFGAVTG
jgi:signal transduction histidine kinase